VDAKTSSIDLSPPYAAISPTLDGTVLAVLAGTTRPLTGREVARLAGRRHHSGVLAVLNRLTEQGVANRQEAGRALLYTLNREHLITPAVERLANLRLEFLRRLREAIQGWVVTPIHVSLFGPRLAETATQQATLTCSSCDPTMCRPRKAAGGSRSMRLPARSTAGPEIERMLLRSRRSRSLD
jgi:hypothetical protein